MTVVMKFGGSSVADAERMREVAAIICSFPDELPCIVLSAMGKVRNPCAALRAAALCVTDAPAGVTNWLAYSKLQITRCPIYQQQPTIGGSTMRPGTRGLATAGPGASACIGGKALPRSRMQILPTSRG